MSESEHDYILIKVRLDTKLNFDYHSWLDISRYSKDGEQIFRTTIGLGGGGDEGNIVAAVKQGRIKQLKSLLSVSIDQDLQRYWLKEMEIRIDNVVEPEKYRITKERLHLLGAACLEWMNGSFGYIDDIYKSLSEEEWKKLLELVNKASKLGLTEDVLKNIGLPRGYTLHDWNCRYFVNLFLDRLLFKCKNFCEMFFGNALWIPGLGGRSSDPEFTSHRKKEVGWFFITGNALLCTYRRKGIAWGEWETKYLYHEPKGKLDFTFHKTKRHGRNVYKNTILEINWM